MSNSVPMLQRLSSAGKGTHPHQPLDAGRAEHAAFFPTKLLRAILDGMTEARYAMQPGAQLAEDAWDATLTMPIHQTGAIQTSTAHFQESAIPSDDGGVAKTRYRPSTFKARSLDEYTRDTLPLGIVKYAMVNGLKYFNDKVREVEEAMKLVG